MSYIQCGFIMLCICVIITFVILMIVGGKHYQKLILLEEKKHNSRIENAEGTFTSKSELVTLVPLVPSSVVRYSLDLTEINQFAPVDSVKKTIQEDSNPIHILFEIANSELRQSLIKKYGGFEALLSKVKHDILHTDDFGTLFRVWVPAMSKHYYYVKVINGTAEADGSHREYYKEVPPDMDTAKEAVAWTYGLHPDDYDVAIRT